MKHGRSRHLIRTIVLLAAIVAAFILVSAAIRYNRKSGLFDRHKKYPEKHSPVSRTEKPSSLTPHPGISNQDGSSLLASVSIYRLQKPASLWKNQW